ncbi:MAG TPA: response regulator [Caulobacteraceae bacterium]|jgi:CheY-like chemotaxis protein|nr:response regulator [Caulobacteraceae bacterium]
MAADAAAPGSFFYVLEDRVRILFVDDDPIMREFAVVHLSTDTASVTVGADGVEALKAIAAEDFDVVLLDLEMPLMDGFEVLSRLRADERTSRLPVVVVTGREDVTAIDRAFQAGATSFLAKPINWRLLSYQIRYVHRTSEKEKALLREQAGVRADAERAGEALKRLASEGMGLLREAMQGPPSLRRMAASYVDLLEETAGVVKAESKVA